MIYNAKNGNVKIGNTDMDYISFGQGESTLVMIPGVGDGLKTAKGLAIPFALMYRKYAKRFKVYVFSRKNQLPEGSTTREMADDLKTAMERLGISQAYIMGISQGGMIAQYLAIDAPAFVKKLVLAVTVSRQNETIQRVLPQWIEMAASNDYKGLFIDTAEKSYSEQYLKKYRVMYPILSRFSKPQNFARFITQANACIYHDAHQELNRITCPTLVVGGDSDQIVGGSSSDELSQQIPGSKLIIYEGLGHGLYTEAKDFDDQVIAFLQQSV